MLYLAYIPRFIRSGIGNEHAARGAFFPRVSEDVDNPGQAMAGPVEELNIASPERTYRTGPKLDAQALDRLSGVDRASADSPTWRGWVLGVMCVSFLALATPYTEFVLNGSYLSLNLLPVGPLILLFYVLVLQGLIYSFAGRLMLGRPDLTLIVCMTFAGASLPGYGYMAYLTGQMAQPTYGATPDNKWDERVKPYLKEWMYPPQDPDKNVQNVARPVEWFMNGLPQDKLKKWYDLSDPQINKVWSAWAIPYGYWALMALCIFGLMMSVCTVMRKQWADRERLPFPLAQVPMELLDVQPGGVGTRKPFLSDRVALIGIGINFALHSWNELSGFMPDWPTIPLIFRNVQVQYMTEMPWHSLAPLHFYIFPAVIGLTYLISLEVSFSIWFFYGIMKLCAYLAVLAGWGATHEDFYSSGGIRGFMTDQGGGALIAFVLFGFWNSRAHMGQVLKRALGLAPALEEETEGLSARACLTLFTICFIGATVWLTAAGFGVGFALLTVVSSLIILTGVTRLASEGGLFYVQSDISPSEILNTAFTPMGLGPHTIVPLGMWSRVFVFDWGRTSPMPGMMNSLKLAADLRLRQRPVLIGMGVALVLALGLGFVSFLKAGLTNPGGGARNLEGGSSWTLVANPNDDFTRSAGKVEQIYNYEKKYDEALVKQAVAQNAIDEATGKQYVEEAAAKRVKGEEVHASDLLVDGGKLTAAKAHELNSQELIPASDMPDAARYDWWHIFWLGLGALLMVLFMILRTRVFWWPHPIGYVTWMHPEPIAKIWFPIFLGWALKWGITQYGGYSTYFRLRRLFIGLVVGEIAAAGFWLVVAYMLNNSHLPRISIN